MSRAAYMRAHRAKAADNGFCSVCCTNDARPGMRTCATCDKRTYIGRDMFVECCQSFGLHRFDCRDAAREARGPGPFGPTTAPSVADVIAAMRNEASNAA